MGQRKSTSTIFGGGGVRVGRGRQNFCQRRGGQRRCGVAAVELAIILPVFVTIVLGCVDLGRFAYTYIAITNAARAGAGYATFTPRPTSDGASAIWVDNVRAAITEELDGQTGFTTANLTINTPSVSVETVNNKDVYTYSLGLEKDTYWRAKVSVEYAWSPIVNWPALPSTLTLRHDVVMRFIR